MLKDNSDTFLVKLDDELKYFKIVFDIGAYHGKLTDQILSYNEDIEVHSFEPFRKSYDFLKDKYQSFSNIALNNVAVSDKAGSAAFNVNVFAETNSLLESVSVNSEIDLLTKTTSAQEVELICIDDYCFKNGIQNIDLVKIDTQGNSYNVLMGMEGLLKAKKVKYLYVETEFIEIYKNEKLFSEIELLMRSYGYSIVDLYNLNYIDCKKLAWCDVLFSPKNEL